MDALDEQHEFRLGRWHVRPLRGIVQDDSGTRRITPKSMDVLLCLVRHEGKVVDRETFIEEVWQGRAFGDDPLNKCIAELRRQLGDRSTPREYIETLPKRGYRLVATAEPIGEPLAPVAPDDDRRRGLRWVALAALLLLGAGLAWQFSRDDPPPAAAGVTIAVLPFDDLDDAGLPYFADAMHEQLIAELSRSELLSVRPRRSTLTFRDRTMPLSAIADALDVDVVVEGSVRRQGDRLRISAELIRAATDESLWADSIERSLSVADLFELQQQIALEIAAALEVTLGASGNDRTTLPTTSLAAYDAFMLGKFHYRRKLPGDIRESVTQFEQAVTHDPAFADAWDWLAYAYNHAATGLGHLPPDIAYPKARAAALRALELAPELATAQSILSYIRAVYDRDWVGAVAGLERAQQLDPNDTGTVWSLAHVYALLGRHDEAIRLTSDLADRFPAEGRNHLEVAHRLSDAGRYEEALERLELAEERGAEPAAVANARGSALVGQGRVAAALPVFEQAVVAEQRAPGALGRLGFCYGRAGQPERALAIVEELESRAMQERVPSLPLAIAYLGVGDEPASLAVLHRAAAERSREMLGIATNPFFATLRDDPDFVALSEIAARPAD